jgi:Uncharacterised nucleotidyltransferase
VPAATLSSNDILLLKAALLDGESAHRAYEAWRSTLDLQNIEYGQQRLLPLLHHNLTRLGIPDPLLSRMRGVRNYHWARNQLRLHAAKPVLTALRAASIPVMALKGAALVASCLNDSSLRPMEDLDFLVPTKLRGEAIKVLRSHGFGAWGIPMSAKDKIFRFGSGYNFVNQHDQGIDLHWHMLDHDLREGADTAFWKATRSAQLAGVEICVPSFPHQILHLIVHGADWNEVSPLRWVSDALTILATSGPEFDWDVVVRESVARRLAPPVQDALCLLAREFNIAIPPDLLHILRRSIGKLARLEFECRKVGPSQRRRMQRAFLFLCDVRRTRDDLMRRHLAASLGPFLVDWLHADGIRRQAIVLLFRVLGRPRSLRGLFHIDRWARRVNLNTLASVNEPIDFAAGLFGHNIFLDGWSTPDQTGRWTSSEARLAWRLPPGIISDVDCEIEAQIFAPATKSGLRVEIWANDHLVEIYSADACPVHRYLLIPSSALCGRGELILTFVVRGAVSRHDAGLSSDTSKLGIHLRRIAIRPRVVGQQIF